jgi:hypothetical protein
MVGCYLLAHNPFPPQMLPYFPPKQQPAAASSPLFPPDHLATANVALSLSLDPVAGQPPESPLPMTRALRPEPCSSLSLVYRVVVPRLVRRHHSSPSLPSRAQSAIPTSPLLPSMAPPSLQVHEQKPGTTDGRQISSPYSQIQGVGTPHLPNPP